MPIVVAKYLGDKITNVAKDFLPDVLSRPNVPFGTGRFAGSFPYINFGINREITSKDTLQDTLKV